MKSESITQHEFERQLQLLEKVLHLARRYRSTANLRRLVRDFIITRDARAEGVDRAGDLYDLSKLLFCAHSGKRPEEVDRDKSYRQATKESRSRAKDHRSDDNPGGSDKLNQDCPN